jgi:GntR family transcriptional regulator
MFEFRLEGHSRIPAYIQLEQQVKHALRLGVLKPSDQLPTVKEIVEKLLLSPNTVLKAYRELENEGLISSRQGKGTFVVRTLADPLLTRHTPLLRRLVRWLRDAQQAGLGEEDIDALIATARQAVVATAGATDGTHDGAQEEIS